MQVAVSLPDFSACVSEYAESLPAEEESLPTSAPEHEVVPTLPPLVDPLQEADTANAESVQESAKRVRRPITRKRFMEILLLFLLVSKLRVTRYYLANDNRIHKTISTNSLYVNNGKRGRGRILPMIEQRDGNCEQCMIARRKRGSINGRQDQFSFRSIKARNC